jgi:hypothetical protein
MTEGRATGAASGRSRHDAASITDREARPELREEQDMADTTTWAPGSVTEDEPLEIEFLEKWAEDPIDRQRRLGIAPHYTSEQEQEQELRANWQMRLQRAREAALQRDWDRALDLMEKPSRLGLLSDWWHQCDMTDEELRAVLPGTWSDAEPDDTEEQWLALWVDATESGRVETEPLPEGDPLTIYRGEPAEPGDGALGIAWSLDRDVATFFALRPPWSSGTGVVIEATVPRSAILGYVTDRNESEVIIDPLVATVQSIINVTEADRPKEDGGYQPTG